MRNGLSGELPAACCNLSAPDAPQVRLVVPVIADLDPSSCPLDIEPLPANGEAENGCKVRRRRGASGFLCTL